MNYIAQRIHNAGLDFKNELLVAGLMEQYDDVASSKSTHPEDISYEKVLLEAISQVIHFNLTETDFNEWNSSKAGDTDD